MRTFEEDLKGIDSLLAGGKKPREQNRPDGTSPPEECDEVQESAEGNDLWGMATSYLAHQKQMLREATRGPAIRKDDECPERSTAEDIDELLAVAKKSPVEPSPKEQKMKSGDCPIDWIVDDNGDLVVNIALETAVFEISDGKLKIRISQGK